MTFIDRVRGYAAHPDSCTAACNWIALLVAANQPIYPFYVLWVVGGDWWIAFWTFLSTPFFLAVPAASRRSSVAGRSLLPLTGTANGILGIKAFGPPSGVALFLIPCALIVAFALRRTEWRVGLGLLCAIMLAFAFNAYAGTPLGRFDTVEYRHFLRLNAISVAALSAMILWTLGRKWVALR